MKEDWLDDIQDRMQGFETHEPAGLWEQIEAQMPKEEKKKRFVLPPVWKGFARVAAVAGLVTVAGVTGMRWAQQDKQQTAAISPSQEHTPAIQKSEEPTPIEVKTEWIAATPKQDKTPAVLQVKETETNIVPDDTDSIMNTMAEATEATPQKTENVRTLPENLPTPANDWQAEQPVEKARRRGCLAIAAYGAGGLGSTSSTTHTPERVMFSAAQENVTWADDPMLGIMLFNKGQTTEHKLRHHIPIRGGVNVAYWFHPRVGIETGAAYSCLLSNSEDGSTENYIATRQTLHYIGIPVNLKCKIYSWRGLDIYASLGGLAEKCVAGDIKKEYVLAKKTQRTEIAKTEEKPWQFSANLAAGIQYNFAPWAGVYIEPGCSYYFDDHSTLQTVYKERPWNFNLNMGVRFAFGRGTVN